MSLHEKQLSTLLHRTHVKFVLSLIVEIQTEFYVLIYKIMRKQKYVCFLV